MTTRSVCWLVAGVLSGGSVIYGQTVPETIQEGQTQPQIASRIFGFALSDAQIKDLGAVEPVIALDPPPALTLSTRQSFSYTDNVRFSKRDPIQSGLWEGQFGVNLVPYSTARWTPFVSAEHFMVRYDRAPSIDYNGQSGTVGSAYTLSPEAGLAWIISYTLRRYSFAHGSENEFYKYGALENEVVWSRRLSVRLAAFAGYGLSWRHASPAYLDRLDNSLRGGFVVQAARTVSIQPMVAGSARTYLNEPGAGVGSAESETTDLNLRAGLALNWNPLPNLSLGGSFWWWGNHSEKDWRDYQATISTASLQGRISF
jgi:hypothetical protein